MIEIKEPKSFDEQIDILKGRGLVITSVKEAKFILSNLNYYRFTAYLLPFKKDDNTYVNGVTFEKIYSIYMFDRELRILLMDILGSIEISFRTYIAYTLAMTYGALGYTRAEHFINKDYHNTFILGLESEKLKNSNKLFIKHHNEKYNHKFPIWVAIEVMPFGMLSKLYSNLLPAEKNFIKNNLCGINPTLIDSWLQSLTHIRNQCAHYGRIYNTLFPPAKVKKEDKIYNLETKKIFSYIVIIKHMVSDLKVWDKFFIRMQQLISEYKDDIDLTLIGFFVNWIEILSKI
ncbi:MAG: Abi family protein [Clostridiaceae bacterium]